MIQIMNAFLLILDTSVTNSEHDFAYFDIVDSSVLVIFRI